MVSSIDDKRVFDRFPTKFPVRFLFKSILRGFGTKVRLDNFSAGGVKITTNMRLSINGSVNLKMDLPDGNGPKTISGEVMWVEKKSAKTWEAGIKFCKIKFMNGWRIYKFVEQHTYAAIPV